MSETIYTIRVNYKSGLLMEFDVTSFNVKTDKYGVKTFEWVIADGAKKRPLELGANEVESVWQVNYRS